VQKANLSAANMEVSMERKREKHLPTNGETMQRTTRGKRVTSF
jgi:hypothetical protein